MSGRAWYRTKRHGDIVSHLIHLSNGCRYERGCNMCEQGSTSQYLGRRDELGEDCRFYRDAQRGEKRKIDF